MKKILLSTCIVLSSILSLIAQPDDLAKMMEEEMSKDAEPDYATATFKTTRLINGHTVENVAAGVLDMRISHRFGAINTGIKQFYGLDVATMRVSLEYGINRWLMIGGGRSTFEKTYDSFLKAKILRQSKGTRNMPITLSYLASMQTITVPYEKPDRTNFFTSNMFFVHQLIIARKFNESFSFQVSPTLVHRNLVDLISTPHDLFSIGMGGRMKLTRRTSINVEYFYQFNKFEPTKTNMLSIGFDIETGGHVFQLCFTNSPYMIEKAFIHQNSGTWKAGDIIGGFNISRNFTIRDPRESKKEKKSEW
jgi:hypothetical protein